MLDTDEISESESITVIQQQIETTRSQYGNIVASIMVFVVAGLLIQSRRNKKQNQDMVYKRNTNITFDNEQENMNGSIPDGTNICQDTNTDEMVTCCIKNSAMNHNHRGQIWSYLVTSGLLIILMGLVLFFWNSYRTPPINNTVAHTILKPVTYSVPSGIRFAKIQNVQVGERAIGTNPEVTDSERATFLPDPDPDPTTWRKLTIEMIKPDGKRLLLRPLSWISESQADIGTTIFLDLPELGAQGLAKVLNIEPCPSIKPGKGNVITGTFHHEAANTIDVHVEGLSKPIGSTDNHPFWSVTRNEFVEAGKLQSGEELHLYSGQTAKVIQILPRPGPEQVHNLEVMNEHVYRVTHIGILVHNVCKLDASDPNVMGHVFKDTKGHVGSAPAKGVDYYVGLFNIVSSSDSNRIPHADAVRRGIINELTPQNVEVFVKLMPDNTQVWVLGRNGKTYDAGVNDVPR